jgi:hypothetical protein
MFAGHWTQPEVYRLQMVAALLTALLLPWRAHSLVVTNPCCESYFHVPAAFGTPVPPAGLNDLTLVTASPVDGCAPLKLSISNQTAVLVERGRCNFTEKGWSKRISTLSLAVISLTMMS